MTVLQPVSYWDRMTARELKYKRCEKYSCIIIPIGVIEAHGPLLPTGLDAMLARMVAHLAAERLQNAGVAPIVFDCVPYSGIVGATDGLMGTISYSAELVIDMLFAAMEQIYEFGFRTFFIVNGDAGTGKSLIPFLFRMAKKNKDFFRAWKGTLSLYTWFDGIENVGHASNIEHAAYTYLCEFTDAHTRELAARMGITSVLDEQQVRNLDGLRRVYPQPRREVFSWLSIPGQPESDGVSSFSYEAYRELIDSGRMRELWELQLTRIANNMAALLGLSKELA